MGWLLVGVSLAAGSAPAAAQSDDTDASPSASTTQAADDEAGPSLEFLEFLGEWESGSGEWIDPSEVQSADWPMMSSDPSGAGDREIGDAN